MSKKISMPKPDTARHTALWLLVERGSEKNAVLAEEIRARHPGSKCNPRTISTYRTELAFFVTALKAGEMSWLGPIVPTPRREVQKVVTVNDSYLN